MTADYLDETLDALRSRVPFHPFTVSLKNGEKFEVDHPMAITGRFGRAVYFGPGGKLFLFDHDGVGGITNDRMSANPDL